MTQKEEKEKRAIDHYYGEKKSSPLDEEMKDFIVTMSRSLDKMKGIDEESLSIPLDDIIQEGLLRNEEKKQRDERRSFILSALIIILSMPIWMIVLGLKTILLWQWILLIPVTLAILPFVKDGNRKEVGSHE